jgi:DNA-directed RNA polymerase subunit M/transcription elongation factor TFIIS
MAEAAPSRDKRPRKRTAGVMSATTPFVQSIQQSVLNVTDELVFPTTRCNVVSALMRTMNGENAVAYEIAAHAFARGRIRSYSPCVQHMLSCPTRSPSDAVLAYVTEANTLIEDVHDPETECVAAINALQFECTVPDAKSSEGDEHCPVCKRGNLEAHGQQTRSLDEGQTLFYKCSFAACGATFTNNS